MKDRFLPVGTIVVIKGINKKIVITGYLSIEFMGKAKMFDYIGYEYPEGMLCKNKAHSFNHYEIEQVVFMGLIEAEYESLNNILLKKNENKIKESFSNFQFDENGVVIFEKPVNSSTTTTSFQNIKEDSVNNSINEYKNPFNEKVEIKEIPKAEENTEDWAIFKNIKFDENGIVIAE